MDDENVLPCAEKIAFDTQKDAQTAATLASYRYGSSLTPYICRYCGLWHVASG